MDKVLDENGWVFGYTQPLPVSPPEPKEWIPGACYPLPLNPYVDENGHFEQFDLAEVIDWKAKGDFTNEWWTDSHNPVETCVCLGCGGDHFVVGNVPHGYETLIKCSKCGFERSIHQG